ncbi:hypothetical protein GUJ93_ZPchr0013g34082 [Zizania palustris]|uniref:glutathione transferase n=1 Tax=Zizania palustris TaxID=103762 RepID=A0A8J6BWU9_ZIZPA|nr:hypothetical protein GUJ93_ZPchr0013g34082 [Zizania palustris]
MSPVKVFGWEILTNVARVLVCLEEVGADYERVSVNFLAGEQNSPEHVERNPFGKVPALQDGELFLFANVISRAIAKYVLRKYRTSEVDLLRESSITEAAMVDMWTEVEAQQYYPALWPVVYECIIFPMIFLGNSAGAVWRQRMQKAAAVLGCAAQDTREQAVERC